MGLTKFHFAVLKISNISFPKPPPSKRNLLQYLPALKDRNPPAALGDYNAHGPGHAGHGRDRVVPGAHALGEGHLA